MNTPNPKPNTEGERKEIEELIRLNPIKKE
jgi:hypothetical protein